MSFYCLVVGWLGILVVTCILFLAMMAGFYRSSVIGVWPLISWRKFAPHAAQQNKNICVFYIKATMKLSWSLSLLRCLLQKPIANTFYFKRFLKFPVHVVAPFIRLSFSYWVI